MLLQLYYNNQLIQLGNILEIRIRESINSPIIEGEVLLYDLNLINYEDIVNQKEIPLNFLVYDVIEDKNKEFIFTVTGIEGGTVQLSNVIALKFTNRYSIDLFSKITSLYYKDLLYSQMLSKLLIGVGFKVKTILESGNSATRLFPYSNNLDKIRYVQDRIVDKNNRGGYLVFPNIFTNEMNIINLNYIIEGKYGEVKYPLYKGYENDAYVGHIGEIVTTKNYDIFSAIKGSSADRYTFNMDKGIVENVRKSTKLPLLLNKEYLDDNYNDRVFTLFSDYTGMNNWVSDDFYQFLQNQINLNIVANGDYSRLCGQLTKVIVYKNDDGKVIDNKLSGQYIIRDLEHLITPKSYQHNMNLIKI